MTIHYVRKTGSDSNNGLSPGTAKLTIMSIVPSLGPNDLCRVGIGSYDEEVTFSGQSGGSWSTPITLEADPSDPTDSVIIAPNNGGSGVKQGLKLENGTSYVQILKLVFDGYYCGGTLISNNIGTPHHNRIQDCEVKNCGRQYGSLGSSGVPTNTNGIITGGHHHEYIRLRVHHNGNGGYDHGFYGLGDDSLMENCDVYENSGHGCQKYSAGDNCIFRGNRFYLNGQSGYLGGPRPGGSGLGIYGGQNTRVYNNLSYKNWEQGLKSHYGEHDSYFDNNTVWANVNGTGSLGGGIAVEEAVYMTIRNNIVIENGGLHQIYTSSLALMQANITSGVAADHFVNAAGGDFGLLVTSSAINAAVDLSSIFTTDFYGNLRG